MAGKAAATALAALALLAGTASAARYRKPLSEATAKPKGAAPTVRFSVNGWTVLLPDQLEVYYDHATLNPDTFELTVSDSLGNSANCTGSATPYVEYIAVPWKICAAPVFNANSGRYHLEASLASRAGGAPQTYTAGTWTRASDLPTAGARAKRPPNPGGPFTRCGLGGRHHRLRDQPAAVAV